MKEYLVGVGGVGGFYGGLLAEKHGLDVPVTREIYRKIVQL